MSTERIKYPEQPHYHATVSQDEALLVERKNPHTCAKCFLGIVSLVFVLLGLAMTGLSSAIIVVAKTGASEYPTLLESWSYGSVITLLVVGLTLFVISVIVWVSSCKPANFCSKVVLIIFSVVMLCVFVVQLALLFLGLEWYNVVDVNISGVPTTSDVDKEFNETIEYIYDACCGSNNSTVSEICTHVLDTTDGSDPACYTYAAFYSAVVDFLRPLLTAVAVFLGVVAFFNLVAFFCSCCLVCAKKSAIYKANSPYFKPPADNAYSSA